MFLRVPGVRGDVNDGGEYQGCFRLDSMQFGVGRSISSGGRRGGDEGREMSNNSCSEVTVSASQCAELNLLAGLSMAGAFFPQMQLHCSLNGVRMTQTLENALFSSFSQSAGSRRGRGNAADEETEVSCSMSINFEAVSQRVESRILRRIIAPKDIDLSSPTPFTLSSELMLGIFKQLNQRDALTFALLSKKFLQVASSPGADTWTASDWGYELKNNATKILGYIAPPSILPISRYGDDEPEQVKPEPFWPDALPLDAAVSLPFPRSVFKAEEVD